MVPPCRFFPASHSRIFVSLLRTTSDVGPGLFSLAPSGFFNLPFIKKKHKINTPGIWERDIFRVSLFECLIKLMDGNPPLQGSINEIVERDGTRPHRNSKNKCRGCGTQAQRERRNLGRGKIERSEILPQGHPGGFLSLLPLLGPAAAAFCFYVYGICFSVSISLY
jgi:hypothetical protein